MSASNIPYDIPKEFNESDCDIVLRSSDEEEFRFFRWPLKHFSPLFSDMFRLPNPSTSPTSSVPPVVQMEEAARVIEVLLRLIYPLNPPMNIEDPQTFALVVGLILKLQAEERCRWWIRMVATNLISVNPWAMYPNLLALGRKSCGYDLEDEIRIAARATLGQQAPRVWKEGSMITAADYNRLLVYHSDCRNAILSSERVMWNKPGASWPWFRLKPGLSHCPPPNVVRIMGFNFWTFKWFSSFIAKAKKALSKKLRVEVIEDVGLWFDLLESDKLAGAICRSCANDFASKMPAYSKVLSESMGEIISQVISSV